MCHIICSFITVRFSFYVSFVGVAELCKHRASKCKYRDEKSFYLIQRNQQFLCVKNILEYLKGGPFTVMNKCGLLRRLDLSGFAYLEYYLLNLLLEKQFVMTIETICTILTPVLNDLSTYYAQSKHLPCTISLSYYMAVESNQMLVENQTKVSTIRKWQMGTIVNASSLIPSVPTNRGLLQMKSLLGLRTKG
ncbi:hypothetical protein SCA6_016683 [Theobroma cacao]